MKYFFQKKFGEKHIDDFINEFSKSYEDNPNQSFFFSLEDTEWMSNQGLLLFTAIIKILYSEGKNFKIIFPEVTHVINYSNKRKVSNIINLWDVWKLSNIVVEKEKWGEYFCFKNSNLSFSDTRISELKKQFDITETRDVYDRYKITPFVELNFIKDYSDKGILESQIEPVFNLNQQISERLKTDGCEHPFINKTISHIVTKELYENFLDHGADSIFKDGNNSAFMSLSLRKNINSDKQNILQSNFKEEELEETISFFKKNNIYVNNTLIEFSFLDFGSGIANTLRKICHENKGDNEILNYAFDYNSSRHPIKKYNPDTFFIPRGLFDVLTIVNRYNGLLIVRSNQGKIIYDFSSTSNEKEAFKSFGNDNNNFPGTLITIYLPAFNSVENKFDSSSIKPKYNNLEKKSPQLKLLNLNSIYESVLKNYPKKDIYSEFILELKNILKNESDKVYVNCISFNGCHDERLNKVALFFLLTDYHINLKNNVVIFHPPSKEFIINIQQEILSLSNVAKEFIIHPIPLIYSEKDIDWLGIYYEEDKMKLNDFFQKYELKSTDDFINPDGVLGNIQYSFGYKNKNIQSFLSEIDIQNTLDDFLLKEKINKYNCIRSDGVYLCNGNYYQKEFLQLLDLLNDEDDCDTITKILFSKLKKNDIETTFIAITSSSHKILKSLIRQGLINEKKCIFLDSYLSFENDKNVKLITEEGKYILFGDVLSGGSIVKRLDKFLKDKKSLLEKVAVIVNSIDEDYNNSKEFYELYRDKIIFAYKHPIRKYLRKDIDDESLKNVIRINPYTNLPNVFSEQNTLKETILFDSNIKFLDYVNEDDILINYKIFNNLIHPYFFNLEKIIEKENNTINTNPEASLSNFIFNHSLKNKVVIDDNLKIFYPKKSDIDTFDFKLLISKILKNQSIQVFELERYNIIEGWKFPHTTDTFKDVVKDKNVLIIDDGSYSGDSILQMVNELVYFKPSKIDLVCLIGKVNDHKREFFSRINKMKYQDHNGNYVYIETNIYFVSHWHIENYFQENSPFTEEISWINKLISFQILPINIKKIASAILTAITPKEDDTEDYKFFPKDRLTNAVPKKQIILVRNEIGKVIGYRFYKENFEFFNNFIKKFEISTIENRYKDIELLCMCFLYEPFLYKKITNIMPDIKEKIEGFIDVIFFGNTKGKKLTVDKMHFDWEKNKRDLLHLFFIIYSDENKLKQLDYKKIAILLEFSKSKSTTSNYILYKILKFFPLTVEEINEKNKFIFLKDIIYDFIEKGNADKQTKNDFKRFYSFLNTLPTGKDITSQIKDIKYIYWNNDQVKTHVKEESYLQNLSEFKTNVRELKDLSDEKKAYDPEKVEKVKDSWRNIKAILLDPILSFYNSHEDFLKPYPYFTYNKKISDKKNSLMSSYKIIDSFEYNLEQRHTNPQIYIDALSAMGFIINYFGQKSQFRKLFESPNFEFKKFKLLLSSNINKICKQYKNELSTIDNAIDLNFLINIPEPYIEKLIIKEIKDNIEFYINKDDPFIKLEISNNLNEVIVTIENSFDPETVKNFSSGEGINSLKLLSNFNFFNFIYRKEVDHKNKIFKQYLIFKYENKG